jgi:riboflavin kinase
VAILGYLRPEQNFESLEDLVRAIENDIKQSRDKLNDASVEKWRHDKFFSRE